MNKSNFTAEDKSKAEMTSRDQSETKTRKNLSQDTIDFKLIAKARKGFTLCLSEMKSNDVKLAYLRKYATTLPDVQKFYDRYMVEANKLAEKLKDSLSVTKACEESGNDILILATHVVFMGKTAMMQVAKYGVSEQSPIHGHLDLFTDQFMPDNAQDFVNTDWLPSKLKGKEKEDIE